MREADYLWLNGRKSLCIGRGKAMVTRVSKPQVRVVVHRLCVQIYGLVHRLPTRILPVFPLFIQAVYIYYSDSYAHHPQGL